MATCIMRVDGLSTDPRVGVSHIACDVPVHMQCNMPLHVISCHMHNECYMDHTIHTTYRCHGLSHHLHMTSIQHFIRVNISYKYISTFTFIMSFYDQAMTNTQASHVMAIAHNNSSHVNMLEYSYLHPNKSLHCQVVAYLQSSHIMAVCTNKLITYQHIRTHILI